MRIDNEELNKINAQKEILVRQDSKGEIPPEEFQKKYEELRKQAMDIIYRELNIQKVVNSQDINSKMEEIKMAEEKPVEAKAPKTPKAPKVPKEPKEPSNAQYILKALQMKSMKTYDDVANKVKEWKPTVDTAKIKGMAKVMTREIQAGKGGKSKKYKWDEENFKLTPVEGC